MQQRKKEKKKKISGRKKNFLLRFSHPSANISFTFVNDRNYFKTEESSNKERGGGG